MNSKKIYQVGFVLLLLINATLIFLLVKASSRPPMGPQSRKGSIIEKISTQLNLSEEQLAHYRSMAKQHGDQMRILDNENQQLLKSYFETLEGNSTDSAEIFKNEILKIESKKLQYTYEHFQELESILNENQKVRFGLIVKDILAVLIGQRDNSRPPPRDHRNGLPPN